MIVVFGNKFFQPRVGPHTGHSQLVVFFRQSFLIIQKYKAPSGLYFRIGDVDCRDNSGFQKLFPKTLVHRFIYS